MTRVLFDTSVLVATMLEEDPHHSKCFAFGKLDWVLTNSRTSYLQYLIVSYYGIMPS
ncbi:hypothetical protein ACE1CI_17715 [Aerosakkonemataceae cyanobacterium BLCC-F50]|uniref:PIN domain-containing protein n=1 Tax=Floridaenema flaviceps BLCC-F50 TaxID=3153642 RepID=A0ABV4XSQ2_9CYAN